MLIEQAVILAAGKSTRTYPLTLTTPKPLLAVGTKTLLEYNLDQLNGLVKEIIIVVGYKKDMIKKKFKNRYKKLKITYVEQKEQLGTGNALEVANKKIRGRFILLMGDDLYPKKDIKKCLRYKYAVLAQRVSEPERFGVFIVRNKLVKDLIEKPQLFISNLANAALYVLDKKIFDEIGKLRQSKRGEYELTDAVRGLAKKEKVYCVIANRWVSVAYPWDLFNAKKLFKIKGNAIGKNCKIMGKAKDSIIMDNAVIEKGSIIKDSIIGRNVKFKGRIISKRNAISIVKKLPVVADKLGAVVGDNCILKNVKIFPGIKIWPNKKISDKIIKEDIT